MEVAMLRGPLTFKGNQRRGNCRSMEKPAMRYLATSWPCIGFTLANFILLQPCHRQRKRSKKSLGGESNVLFLFRFIKKILELFVPSLYVTNDCKFLFHLIQRYQCQYIDQSTKFLPPSAYYANDESPEARGAAADDPESSSLGALPECRTPLSVLCVSTNDMDHRLYLHGRYPLLSLPRSKNDVAQSAANASSTPKTTKSPMVVASNDLAHWLTTAPSNSSSSTGSGNFLTLYHTPFLKRDRYALQQIATLHTSITAHLQTIERSVSIVADSWKTSLRPLDQKLKPLTNLLRNYGVEVGEAKDGSSNTVTTLSTVMKEYIMMGHVNHSTSIANAMDQFFTGIQMNDQLVQRMERSLVASMANAESTAIRCLLRPTQALGWQIQELSGLVRFFSNIENANDAEETPDCSDLENKSQMVQELTDATEELWISVENVMTSIVAGRMLVRDFIGWLRHAGSQVKARGTAPNSVQRENAKKRRITQAVLERLVAVLNKSGKERASDGIGLSETLLNLKVTVRAPKFRSLCGIFLNQII